VRHGSSIVENQSFSSVAGVDCAPPNASILMANFAAMMLDQILVPVHVASQGKCQANDDQRNQAEPDGALKSGTCQLPHASSLWVGAKTIVRHNHLPLAIDVHPNVGETIPVLVGLTLFGTLLVVRASDHSRVAVHSNLEIRHV
jgi:hypothetical protein